MDELRHEPPDPESLASGHEQSDVAIRPLAIFLAALATLIIVVGGVIAWMFGFLEGLAEKSDPPPPSLAQGDSEAVAPRGPRLQVSPRGDFEQLRAREEKILNTAEWIDRDGGIARIPINRAIEIVARDGLPNWPAAEVAQPAADSPPAEGARQP